MLDVLLVYLPGAFGAFLQLYHTADAVRLRLEQRAEHRLSVPRQPFDKVVLTTCATIAEQLYTNVRSQIEVRC